MCDRSHLAARIAGDSFGIFEFAARIFDACAKIKDDGTSIDTGWDGRSRELYVTFDGNDYQVVISRS